MGMIAILRQPSEPLQLVCGRNAAGLWVLQSFDGGYGCLFPTREAALDEAMTGNDGEPVTVVLAREPVELDFTPRDPMAVAALPAPAATDLPAAPAAAPRPVRSRRPGRPEPWPVFGLSGFVAASLAVIAGAAGLFAALHPL